MKTQQVSMFGLMGLLAVAGCAANQELSSQPTSPDRETQASDVQVIMLTQTGCQFLEVESQDYRFSTTSAADCQAINARTMGDRQPGFKPLQLAPGEYIFRVTNQNVPYELGFYLRGEGLSQATLPKVSGGGLLEGVTQDYQVTLKPGSYVFSCPLNPTPDYPIIVQ